MQMACELLVWIQFLFISALVFQNNGIVFAVVWILFFIDRVPSASVFFVTMSMI